MKRRERRRAIFWLLTGFGVGAFAGILYSGSLKTGAAKARYHATVALRKAGGALTALRNRWCACNGDADGDSAATFIG